MGTEPIISLSSDIVPMEVDLRTARMQIRRGAASVEVRRTRVAERAALDDFVVTVGIADGALARKYTGSIFSTARDIVSQTGGLLALLSAHGTRVFADGEHPLLECVYRDGECIRIDGLCRLFLVRMPVGCMSFRDASAFSRLRRLQLRNCSIRHIPDLSWMRLTHVDLSCNCIEEAWIPGVLDVVNLSRNRISVAVVEARNLDLSCNRIKRFSSSFRHQHLNLSRNPLQEYSGHSQVLDVSHTQLQTVDGVMSRKIFLDGTRDVVLGRLRNARFLSLNGCGLSHLALRAKRLRVLRARNNYLEAIPNFPSLECLDISGNLVYRIGMNRLVFLNASRNQLIRFDLEGWTSLRHLDLSYNPLMDFDVLDVSRDLKTLNLGGTRFGGMKSRHVCDGDAARRYEVDGDMWRLFLIASCDARDVVERIRGVEGSGSLEHFQRIQDAVHRWVFERDAGIRLALCMVTQRHVFVNASGIDIVFSNFAEVRMCGERDAVHVYDNIGSWNAAPVLCTMRHSTARFDILDTFRNNVDELMDFLGHRCPLAAGLGIFGDAVRSGTGYENYNPVLETSMRWQHSSLVNNPNPVFMFCKLAPRNRMHGHLCVVGNTRNIVKMLNQVFFGTTLEFFSDYCIVAFNDRVEACLWALRMQDMMGSLGLDVCIGITSGVFYTKIVDNHVRFYGPALNKAARLSSLGIGVFCCHCVWTKHPCIVYIDHGLRHLGGFDEPHLVYTPQLAG